MRLCLEFGARMDYWGYRLVESSCSRWNGKILMRLIWSLPRKPMSNAHRLSYPSTRKGWRGIPTPQRMMTKKRTRINSLEYQPLSPVTVGFKWGGKEFYLSWHHRGGLRRCPLKSQHISVPCSSPSALKLSKLYSLHTHPSGGEKGWVFQGNGFGSALCWESRAPSMKDKTWRAGVWESKKMLIFKEHLHNPQPSSQ